MPEFLPISRADMTRRGWDQCDFVYIIGDGYVDHPSFGHAIISRVLEDAGYKVGILSQPDWKDPASIDALGEPRLGFLVMGGNMDSMVNHYTVSKAHRKTDAYTPGGVMGKRPDYAVTVYCNLIRRTYRRKRRLLSSVLVSSFPNRKLNLRFGSFLCKSATTSQSRLRRASIPTPFVPSGHFPLIGGIGPWKGSQGLTYSGIFSVLPAGR